MIAQQKILLCVACGHRHTTREGCADHGWTAACPAEGIRCPTEEERRQCLRQKRERDASGEHHP